MEIGKFKVKNKQTKRQTRNYELSNCSKSNMHSFTRTSHVHEHKYFCGAGQASKTQKLTNTQTANNDFRADPNKEYILKNLAPKLKHQI